MSHRAGPRVAVRREARHPGRVDSGVGASVHLGVMCSFHLRINNLSVSVPTHVERVLAYLAVHERPQHRRHVAAHLWMDTAEERAGANLRNALWRARHVLGDQLVSDGSYLALSPDVDVDLRRLTSQAHALLRTDVGLHECDTDPTVMLGDLLPDWDEEWIVGERERLRHLRVHALEALCEKLCSAGRNGEAVDVGLMAVSAEPLRESAQRLLVSAHLAEGNMSEARRQYHRYRDLLWEELGIEPSPELRVLVGVTRRSGGSNHETSNVTAQIMARRQIVPRRRLVSPSGSSPRSSR